MYKKTFPWIAIAIIVIVAIGIFFVRAPSPKPLPAVSSKIITQPNGPQNIRSEALKLSFEYPTPLIEQRNDSGSAFASSIFKDARDPKNDMKIIFANTIGDFKRVTDGIADYAMPQRIKDQLSSSANACDVFKNIQKKTILLKNGELSMPVEVETEPFLCQSQKAKDGSTVMSLVGIQFGYEGPDVIETMILVVRKNDVVMLTHVLPDLMYADFKKVIAANPNVDFGNNPGWKKLHDTMLAQHIKVLKTPNAELQKGFADLQKIASTVQSY